MRILPPAYKKAANPNESTLIADDEKNPSFKSNSVELHKASEKKPIGSHSVLDLNLRLFGHITFDFSIDYMKQLAHIISSPKMSARVVPLLFFLLY